MATIQIKRGAAVIFAPQIDDNSKISKTLMGEEKITLSFTWDSFIEILIGDYIQYEGVTYTVAQEPSFNKLSEAKYQYSIVFQGPKQALKETLFLLDGSSEFFLSGTAGDFLDLIITNLNRSQGGGYSKGSAEDTEIKNLSFSVEDTLSVLSRICQEFSLEYTINNKVLSLVTSVGNASGVNLAYRDGLQEIKRSRTGGKEIITRLYAYGSSKNLGSDYGASRLKLPDPGYIENNTAVYGVREGAHIFEDIYPHFEGGVDSVIDSVTFQDGGIDFNLNDYLLEGTTAKVNFLTGDLAGMELEVESYDHTTKRVKVIAYQDEQDNVWPGETFSISPSDRYTFTDIKQPASRIAAAEAELLSAAGDLLTEVSAPNVIYEVKTDWHALKEDLTTLETGDTITITDPELAAGGVDFRILSSERSLANPYKYTVKIGDVILLSYFQRVEMARAETLREVTEIKRINTLSTRRAFLKTEQLKELIFDPDGYFDAENIKPLSIETGMLSVGMKSLQMALKGVEFTLSPGGDNTKVNSTAGSLTHFTLLDTVKTWTVAALNKTGLTEGADYYIYAKCSKSGSGAAIYYTDSQFQVDPGGSYYYLLLGVLHGSVEGERAVSMVYGATTVTGRLIKTGRISSQDGSTYFDLDSNIIAGKITFRSGKSDAELENEVNEISAKTPGIYRIISRGMSCVTPPGESGIYDYNNNLLRGHGRSYNLVVYDRKEDTWGGLQTFDVYGSSAEAEALATALDALTSADIFVLYTHDEPYRNSAAGGLSEAIARNGGTEVRFKAIRPRSSYILIGIGGVGEGNGIELSRGDIDNDPDAWTETAIVINNGILQLPGTKIKNLESLDPGAVSDISSALVNAAGAQATADGKIDSFFQSTPPTGASEGDIWFKTSEGNTPYRYTSGAWESAKDSDIAAALLAASSAQATADGKVRTYYQDGQPSGASVGDLWVDTDNGNKLYRYNGSTWQSATVSGLSNIDQSASDKLAGIAPGAQVTAPTIGIKINYSAFNTPATGEAYIHGFESNGDPADVAGFYYYNGIKVTVQGTVWTQQPGEGYIVRFASSGGLYFCKKENGVWYYDNNTSWIQFTPGPEDLVIGTMVCNAADNIQSATILGYPLALDTVSETAADRTKSTIDGGIITSGRILLGATDTEEGVNAGVNGYGITDEAIRIWAGAPWETDGGGNNAYNAPFRVYHDGRLYASKAVIQGEISANAGDIGGFSISGSKIESQTAAGSVILNAEDLSLTLMESGGQIRGKIHNADISSLNDLAAGADGEYSGTAAKTYTDISLALTGEGDIQEKTYCLEKLYTSSNVLDQKVASQGSSYYINANSDQNLDAGKWYHVILNINRKAAGYTLATEHSKPVTAAEGTVDYDSTVSLAGQYRVEIITELYSSAGVLLSSDTLLTPLKSAGELSGAEVKKVFDKAVKIPTSSVYFKVKYKVYNNAYQQVMRNWFRYTGGAWIPTDPISSIHNWDLNIDYNFEVESLSLDTDYELTEIGADGLLSYWGENKYLLLSDSLSNSDENSAFLQSNGFWTHRGSAYFSGVEKKVNIKDGTTPLSSGKLNVATQGEEYAATFRNDGNSPSSRGLLIRCGSDTPGTADNIALQIEDGDGNVKGSIFFDNEGIKIYNAVSGNTLTV